MRVNANGEEVNPGTVRSYWHVMRQGTLVEGESLTLALPSVETDVNEIIHRFERTGFLPESDRVPQYGDVTGLQKDLTVLLAEREYVNQTFEEFAESWSPAVPDPEPIPTPSPPNPIVENTPP